ncbi:MAG: efflux RND transporter periplasmic adaptor subunit, partial [Acidobacteria bacterium]|nr:efflux RND transporter periplasmic adaptor subunit [Acidobacteriota bacterium]
MFRPSRAGVLVPSLLLLAAGVCLSRCGSDAGSAPIGRPAASATAQPPADAVAVRVAEAVTADIESSLQISGSLAAQSRVGVTPRVPGRLERVVVDLGDRVSPGTTIATLDRREIDAQVDAAVAAVAVAAAGLEAADAGLTNAAQEIERARNLFEKGALPRQRLDGAETVYRAASAQRDLARASLAQAQAAERHARELSRDLVLASPIAGVIVERNQDPGALVGRGEAPVVVVADTRVLKLEAGVSELEAGRLRVGLSARVSVAARPGETFDGTLAALAPEVDARNRHFRIEIRLQNTKHQLLAGMYATARILV